ncbi:unnamed protein product [Aureobasidium pullulans]|nr:unnamed protein product [Aureobasidium pullulans]
MSWGFQNVGPQVSAVAEAQEIYQDSVGFMDAGKETKVRLSQAWPADRQPPAWSSLLSVASGKGSLAAATSESVILVSTETVQKAYWEVDTSANKIKDITPQLSLPVPQVSHVAFSADESSLAIAAQEGGGLAVYDVQALLQGNKESAFQISTNGISVRALEPNPSPENAHLFAVVLTDGKLMIADFKQRQLVNTSNGAVFREGVRCVSWSVRGKQLVVGLEDGSAEQYDPQGNAASSTYHMLHREKSSGSFTSQLIVGDPCIPGFDTKRFPAHFLISRLRKFPPHLEDVLILSSSAGTEAGIITNSSAPLAKDAVYNVYTVTNMDADASRATLPMSVMDGMSETAPVGMALDLSSTDPVLEPIASDKEVRESPGPVPALMILNNEGVLSAWWFIYNDSIRQGTSYPGLTSIASAQNATPSTTQPATSIPTSSAPAATGFAAFAVYPAFGQASTPAFGKPSTPAFGQASTPAFGKPSTPAFGQASTPAFGQASKPAFGQASTPAFGKSAFGSPSLPGAGAASALGSKSPWGQPASQASIATPPKGQIFGAGLTSASATSQPAFGKSSGLGETGSGSSKFTATAKDENKAPASPFSALPSPLSSSFGKPSAPAATPAQPAEEPKEEAMEDETDEKPTEGPAKQEPAKEEPAKKESSPAIEAPKPQTSVFGQTSAKPQSSVSGQTPDKPKPSSLFEQTSDKPQTSGLFGKSTDSSKSPASVFGQPSKQTGFQFDDSLAAKSAPQKDDASPFGSKFQSMFADAGTESPKLEDLSSEEEEESDSDPEEAPLPPTSHLPSLNIDLGDEAAQLPASDDEEEEDGSWVQDSGEESGGEEEEGGSGEEEYDEDDEDEDDEESEDEDEGEAGPFFAPPSKTQESPRSPSPIRPSSHTPAGLPASKQHSKPITVPSMKGHSRSHSRPSSTQRSESPQVPDAGELSDEEDVRVRELLASEVEPSMDLEPFVAHQDYVGRVNKLGIAGQIEKVYRDINSMIDTLGLNARTLESFVKGHETQYKQAGRERSDLEQAEEWCLVEINDLGVVQKEIGDDLEAGKMRKQIGARADPQQRATHRASPLNNEAQMQQNELREGVAKVQKLLQDAEEALSVLRSAAQRVPTVEAVTNTIMKMTAMIEQKSGDVDVLEAQIRRLPGGIANLNISDSNEDLLRSSVRSVRPLERSTSGNLFGTPPATRGKNAVSNDNGDAEFGRSSLMLDGTPRRKMADISLEEVRRYQDRAAQRKRVLAALKQTVEKKGTRVTGVERK